MTVNPHQQSYQQELLFRTLHKIFGDFDQTLLETILPQMSWIEVSGGETLFRQGDEGDALYFVISGRMRALITDLEGNERIVGEIMRGETVGEMAVFTGESRTATIVAIRDAVLVKLTKEVFEKIIFAYPRVSLNVTKLIIERQKRSNNPRVSLTRPINICFLPLTKEIDLQKICEDVLPQLNKKGKSLFLTSRLIDEKLGNSGMAQSSKNQKDEYLRVNEWLDRAESEHEFMVYIADDQDSEWTKRCVQHSDEVILFAHSDDNPEITAIENKYLYQTSSAATQVLVVLHPKEVSCATNTHRWLEKRNTKHHLNIRLGLEKDMNRLGRYLAGNSIGLVFAGGGAKGFAELGVYKALLEYRIPVDYVGGTSIGAVMASYIAFDTSIDEMLASAKKEFTSNPTNDYNFFPFVALVKGQKTKKIINGVAERFLGKNPLIENTWINYYCVSSNYSQHREEVHTRGRLDIFVRASLSIPGVLPPVVNGNDLLIDGGTFNNYPADVMNRLGVQNIIGVNMIMERNHKLTFNEVPTAFEILKDKFRPKKKRKYRVPSLISILLNTTILYSVAREKETQQYLDLKFNPDVSKVGILDWQSFDTTVQKGYDHAIEILSNMTEEELNRFR